VDLKAYRHTETITIDRPAEDIYDLVADVAKMGSWSPVCTGGEYDAGSATWFTGHNAIGEFTWSTRCEVVVADRPREFAFVNHGGDGKNTLVRWGFQLEGAGAGTDVTQTWEVLPEYVVFVRAGKPEASDGDIASAIDGMKGLALTGMPETLAKLKADAESA
jgi:carbon monoxide dehydrogenase subunit G